jgi:hypothetical protein
MCGEWPFYPPYRLGCGFTPAASLMRNGKHKASAAALFQPRNPEKEPLMIPKPYSLEVCRLARNARGRDLIVGDIHGHFTKLAAALEAIGFDDSIDRLISVGDLVDRGPESLLALGWLAKPWFHAVRGNHEDMLCMYSGRAVR